MLCYMHSLLTNYVLAEKWAKCYHHFHHGDTDTNMYLILNHQEIDGAILIFFSFHNQLKTVQLNGKVNRRVDFLLHQLLNYEKMPTSITKGIISFHQQLIGNQRKI